MAVRAFCQRWSSPCICKFASSKLLVFYCLFRFQATLNISFMCLVSKLLCLASGNTYLTHTDEHTGPLGSPVEAQYGVDAEQGIAVIEMASASYVLHRPCFLSISPLLALLYCLYQNIYSFDLILAWWEWKSSFVRNKKEPLAKPRVKNEIRSLLIIHACVTHKS